MKSNYKAIGELVERVDERNRDASITTLIGVSIDKKFIPSVANVIGTDLTNYKVIRKFDFAVSLMQVSRDEKIPVACQKEYEAAIMSPAYPIFRVKDTGIILPEYMEMWFMRSEFDREASFVAVGGVRGSMPWEEFAKLKLPVPTIEEQRKIVDRYNAITDRIALKKQINDNLEATAQALYQELFVDNSDISEWKSGCVGDVLQLQRGHDLPRTEMLGGEYPVAGSTGTIGYHNQYTAESPVIVMGRSGNIGNPRLYLCNCWTHNTSLYVKQIFHADPMWTYYMLKNLNYDSFVGGSAVPTLNRNDVHAYGIAIPPIELQETFGKKVMKLIQFRETNLSEIAKLNELQCTVLATISSR